MLAVSGDLDPTPGGPHPFPDSKSWGFTQHNPFTAVYDHDRRSVYLMTQRIKRHPFLALFDGPDPNSCTGRRDSTTVPTQALFFLNDPFVHARADSLAAPARRPARRRGAGSTGPRRLLFGRPPREAEAALADRFLASSRGRMPGSRRTIGIGRPGRAGSGSCSPATNSVTWTDPSGGARDAVEPRRR